MSKLAICKKCGMKCEEPCIALRYLYRFYEIERKEQKNELLKELRDQLNLVDYEPSEELRNLAERIIDKLPDVSQIKDYDIRIGYVLSYEAKTKDGKTIYADCRKVTGPYLAYIPYDFIITFYEPNISMLSENQKKVVMWHELKHPDMGPRGLRNRPHDKEDFYVILEEMGLYWGNTFQDVPDILAGEENAEDHDQKAKAKKPKKKEQKQ